MSITAFDPIHKRLALFKKEATPEFWDAQWKQEDLKQKVSSGKTYHFIKKFTQKYIPPGGRILEGGCGTGQVVYALESWGYDTHGIDFAKEIIETVTSLFPHLHLSVQDVKQTNFPDHSFDGYWSLGVIEHFWNGYDDIIQEASRIIKPGGHLFLSFPVMSPLRKLKARLGCYPLLSETHDTKTFYEFMLDPDVVTQQVNVQGFNLVETFVYDALKGVKDEIKLLQPLLQRIYNGKNVFTRGFRFGFTLLFARLTGHMILLVLKKRPTYV